MFVRASSPPSLNAARRELQELNRRIPETLRCLASAQRCGDSDSARGLAMELDLLTSRRDACRRKLLPRAQRRAPGGIIDIAELRERRRAHG